MITEAPMPLRLLRLTFLDREAEGMGADPSAGRSQQIPLLSTLYQTVAHTSGTVRGGRKLFILAYPPQLPSGNTEMSTILYSIVCSEPTKRA